MEETLRPNEIKITDFGEQPIETVRRNSEVVQYTQSINSQLSTSRDINEMADNGNLNGHNDPEPETAKGGWVVIAAAAAVLFVGVGYTNAFGVFEEYYESTLLPSEQPDKIIVIGSIAASLYMLLGVLTGRFADLVGYRISLVVGSTLMIASMFAASVSTEYYQLFLSQGVMFGIGVAFVYMPATTISRQYFGPRMAGLSNGVVVSGGALGGFILPFVFRTLTEKTGLAQTFRISGYIAIGVLVPSVILLKPKNAKIQKKAGHRRLLDLALLRNIQFLLLLISCTVAMTGFLPRYFLIPASAQSKGISVSYSSWLLGMMNGLSIFGRIGVGIVADRYGQVLALSLSFILCGLGHFAFWLPAVASNNRSPAPTVLYTLFVVYIGFFGSGFISLFPVVVAHLFGKENLASKTGILNTAIGLSTLAGPSAVYAIIGSGAHQRWILGIAVSGLFLLLGGVMLLAGMRMVTSTKKAKDDPLPGDCEAQAQAR